MIAAMNIVPVRAFRDNYIWLLTKGRFAAAVDPGDASPVLDFLQQNQLSLCGILITHHHDDHIGGVEPLLMKHDVPVFAPRNERYSFAHKPVTEGDVVNLPEMGVAFHVIDVPGHTSGHVAYYGGISLFCGDTLFGCGCGRIFDGSCRQLYHSLQKLTGLPDETRVYCAHEYTLENLRFARWVDPENPSLLERERIDTARVAQGEPTLPSTLAVEKATNPFLRCHAPAIRSATGHTDASPDSGEDAIFCTLRQMKNNYKS